MIKVGTVLKVAEIVANVFEVSMEDLLSGKRKFEIIKARFTLYKILQKLGCKPAHIGKSLDKNHTTIAHGLSEFDNLYSFNDKFRVKADIAINQLIKTKYEEDTDTTEVRKG
jgi:chromosomal replication initiation ATPase DnaA